MQIYVHSTSEITLFAFQNTPFHRAKHAILKSKIGYVATQNYHFQ